MLNYPTIKEELVDMYRTNMPDEMLLQLMTNQMLDDTEWTVDTFSVTGSGGSEVTYSTPGSAAYVMIPNESDIAEAKRLMEAVLTEKKD